MLKTLTSISNKIVEEYKGEEKAYRLDPNAPSFSGRKDENVEKWITMMNNNLKAAGVPEEKKLYVITNYVKESALNTLIKYQRDTEENE